MSVNPSPTFGGEDGYGEGSDGVVLALLFCGGDFVVVVPSIGGEPHLRTKEFFTVWTSAGTPRLLVVLNIVGGLERTVVHQEDIMVQFHQFPLSHLVHAHAIIIPVSHLPPCTHVLHFCRSV